MDFLNYFFWGFAFFAILYGALLLVLPKDKLTPQIKKQLAKKGNNNPTDEELSGALKKFKMYGIVCLVAGGVLLVLQFTGGVF